MNAAGDGGLPVIRTPDQRLRVFVSSTLGELAAERTAVRAAIERLRLIPVMFELGARPHAPAQLYRAYLEQSHVFIGIYWQRYGWTAPDSTVSGLEDEFLLSAGMPRLMYIKQPAPERDPKLAEMLGRLANNPDASYRSFTTAEELAELIESDLAILLSERFEASQSSGHGMAAPSRRNSAPPLSSLLSPPVGRDRELAEIETSIRSGARLLTITGVGGVGKSRVAFEVACKLHADFDEVRFIRLGDLGDASLVAATVVAALGVAIERTQSGLDALVGAIGDDRVLLVLDNLEQVVQVGPDLSTLLRSCPRLHLLVTSRQVLHVRGEHEVPLAPLTNDSAVEMFVEHARVARPSFQLDASNSAAVAELCRRLDGLPLAIELVASRVRLLAPSTLLERIGDRLLQLASATSDLPDRQRTLEATLDWSHRLLSAQEQVLFARLGVFSGGAVLEAVDAVCGGDDVGDVLETLAALLEKSLVVMVDDPNSGTRVGMLQTVRAYARSRLQSSGDLAIVSDRHASWYLEQSLASDPSHRAGAIALWPAMEAELPNIRATVDRFVERDDTAALAQLGASLWLWFWITGKVSEAGPWVRILGSRLDAITSETDGLVVGQLQMSAGVLNFWRGDHDTAAALCHEALARFDSSGDLGAATAMRCMLALISSIHNELQEGLDHANRAVAAARALRLDWGLAEALAMQGLLVRRTGASEEGRAIQLEALELSRGVGERVQEGQILGHIAVAEMNDGNFDSAGTFLSQAIACCRQTRQMEVMAFCLEIRAGLVALGNRPRQAAELIGAADEIRDQFDMAMWWPGVKVRRERLVAELREALGDDAYAAATTEGRLADPFELSTVHISRAAGASQ